MHPHDIPQEGKVHQFVDRFRNATLKIHGNGDINNVTRNTSNSLQESLSLDPLNSLENLFIKANKYILYTKVMQTVRLDNDIEQKKKNEALKMTQQCSSHNHFSIIINDLAK